MGSSSSSAPRSLQLPMLREVLDVGEWIDALPPDEAPRRTLITRSEPELTVNVALLATTPSAMCAPNCAASWDRGAAWAVG